MPATTTIGQILHLTGSGFAPGAQISIGYYPGPVTQLTGVKASVTGTFAANIRVKVLGSHTYVAAGTGGNGKARYLEASSSTHNAWSPSSAGGLMGTLAGVLPFTGPNPNPWTRPGTAPPPSWPDSC